MTISFGAKDFFIRSHQHGQTITACERLSAGRSSVCKAFLSLAYAVRQQQVGHRYHRSRGAAWRMQRESWREGMPLPVRQEKTSFASTPLHRSRRTRPGKWACGTTQAGYGTHCGISRTVLSKAQRLLDNIAIMEQND